MGKIKNYINIKKNSLKFTFIFYYMIIFFIFVCIFIFFSYLTIKDYYYNNLKANMLSQSIYATEIYESYASSYSLNDIVLNERFEFLNNIKGQVQLLDNNAVLYYDNTGSTNIGSNIDNPDNLIKNNEKYSFAINRKTMALNYPIIVNNNQIGILRTITSLKSVNNDVNTRTLIFALFGLFSLFLGFILLYYFANKFLKPINQLNNFAHKLSNGQYNEKSNMSYFGEIGELAKTMDEMSSNIIEKEEIKNEFISSVSHELRTPLTSIKGWALTLQDSSLDEQTKNDGLVIIERESDRLTDMVEDLLDFSRFSSPSFTLTKTEFDLIEIVKNITRQMKPRTNKKEIDLILDYSDNYIQIIADENRLKQVFINIIDNAIKFTPEKGSIVVSIIKDEQDKYVTCEIIDSGIGISEKDISLVTTKFYKGTSQASHTGLGLSIVEEIILKHDGKLEISSVEGEGTTVHFELPLNGGVNEEV